MEHPLVSVDPNLSVEQLQSKITELNKKLAFARRTGNGHLCSQIIMALEAFNNRYQIRLQEMYDATRKSSPDYSDRIDIS